MGGIKVLPLNVKQVEPLHMAGISTVVRLVQGRAYRVIVGVIVAVVKQVGRVVRITAADWLILLLRTDLQGHVFAVLLVLVLVVSVVVIDVVTLDDELLLVVVVVVLNVKSVVKNVDDEEMGLLVKLLDVLTGEVVVVVETVKVMLPVRLVGPSSEQVELQPQF